MNEAITEAGQTKTHAVGGHVRARLAVRGAVQGVGFRPFVFRLATEHALTGWVRNSTQGVLAEIEGRTEAVSRFLTRLRADRPVHSAIQGLETVYVAPVHDRRFEIRPSEAEGEKHTLIPLDLATCPACLQEVLDPANRRFRYPFTNCTECGPRFSILTALPYDRPNTSMRAFTMCPRCQAEYEDPANRRFHAQPNACPVCGPRLELWDRAGRAVADRDAALRQAVRALRAGAIVAVKGLGGFHLLALASSPETVAALRQRKRRGDKPFAVMFPTLAAVQTVCAVSPLEARLLTSGEAPIVLLHRRPDPDRGSPGGRIAPGVAPHNPNLGVLLPYTPLHHLLLHDLGEAVVATSGNRADEPLCIEEQEALSRLGDLADGFLVHNRPIVRHLDDSIVRVMGGRPMVLRRGRGYAPWPVPLAAPVRPVLGVGAQLKSAVALAAGQHIFLSQHIGDLATAQALAAFQRVARDLPALYNAEPEIIAADAHPDYLSTQHAQESGQRVVCVQHHYAHVLSCMAENNAPAPLLGVSWDGTGFGADGTIWGGEFLRITETAFERVAHLRTFRLPGGEAAVEEPRRSALGLLYELFGEAAFEMTDVAPVNAFSAEELSLLRQMLAGGVNSPLTSSAGRLFDAVAAIMGLRQKTHFEGQAAMDLEFVLDADESEDLYPFHLGAAAAATPASPGAIAAASAHHDCSALRAGPVPLVVDWAPMIQGILQDLRLQFPVWVVSAKFHNTLTELIVAVARQVGEARVALTGGCFQNKYLLERTVWRLKGEGFLPCWHERVPPNDGGLAVGQVMAALRAPR